MTGGKPPPPIAAGAAPSIAATAATARPSAPKVVAPFNTLHTHAGHVVYLDLPRTLAVGHEQADPRPYLVISDNARMHANGTGLVIGVPLTASFDKTKPLAYRILIQPSEIISIDFRFKKIECLALTDHVMSFSLDRADCKVGEVPQKVVDKVRVGLAYLFGWN